MATSGTVATTRIKTAKLLEKAFRRCGLLPQQITPEYIESGKESLFMLLMNLSNRGMNLWCLEQNLIGLVFGQSTYDLPVGTVNVLNLLHATPSRVTGTDSVDPLWYQTTLDEATRVVRVGVSFSALPTAVTYIQWSSDGVSWSNAATISANDLPTQLGTWNWYDLDPSPTAQHYRVFGTNIGVVADLYLATQVREIPIPKFNRDDYANQPNKDFMSAIATNYYFQKLTSPKVTLWPVPNDDERHLVLFRQRQVQDVGAITNELEIPDRWLDAVTWQLASRVAFEVPEVTPERRKEVVTMAKGFEFEAETGETDDAPTTYAPNIRGYTR